jgi:hypothetical protein
MLSSRDFPCKHRTAFAYPAHLNVGMNSINSLQMECNMTRGDLAIWLKNVKIGCLKIFRVFYMMPSAIDWIERPYLRQRGNASQG